METICHWSIKKIWCAHVLSRGCDFSIAGLKDPCWAQIKKKKKKMCEIFDSFYMV